MKAIIGVVLLLFFGGVLRADNVVFESGTEKSSVARTVYLRGMQQLSTRGSVARASGERFTIVARVCSNRFSRRLLGQARLEGSVRLPGMDETTTCLC